MSEELPITTANSEETDGLVKARRRINAARERGVSSDGGSTGRTDGND